MYPQNSSNVDHTQTGRPTPSITPQTAYNTNAAPYSRQTSYAGANQYTNATHSVPQQASLPYQYTPQATQPASLVAAHHGSYNASTPAYNRTISNNAQPVQYSAQQATNGVAHRTAEAYVLSDAANAAIPKHVREQFPSDDQGRVLFFSSLPLDTRHIVSGSSEDEQGRPLEHSEAYQQARILRKRKYEHRDRDDNTEVDGDATIVARTRQIKATKSAAENQATGIAAAEKAMGSLAEEVVQSTHNEYKAQYGNEWRQILAADLNWVEERRRKEQQRDHAAERRRRMFRDAHLGNLNGQYAMNAQGYITGWQKNFFTSTYLDDHNSRLP